MMEAREVLEEIVAGVKQFVDPVAIAAKNVRGHAMKMLALRRFDGTADHRGMRQFDIGIEKEHIGAFGVGGTEIASDGGHSAPDHADIQAVSKTEDDLRSAVGGVGISDQHSRT